MGKEGGTISMVGRGGSFSSLGGSRGGISSISRGGGLGASRGSFGGEFGRSNATAASPSRSIGKVSDVRANFNKAFGEKTGRPSSFDRPVSITDVRKSVPLSDKPRVIYNPTSKQAFSEALKVKQGQTGQFNEKVSGFKASEWKTVAKPKFEVKPLSFDQSKPKRVAKIYDLPERTSPQESSGLKDALPAKDKTKTNIRRSKVYSLRLPKEPGRVFRQEVVEQQKPQVETARHITSIPEVTRNNAEQSRQSTAIDVSNKITQIRNQLASLNPRPAETQRVIDVTTPPTVIKLSPEQVKLRSTTKLQLQQRALQAIQQDMSPQAVRKLEILTSKLIKPQIELKNNPEEKTEVIAQVEPQQKKAIEHGLLIAKKKDDDEKKKKKKLLKIRWVADEKANDARLKKAFQAIEHVRNMARGFDSRGLGAFLALGLMDNPLAYGKSEPEMKISGLEVARLIPDQTEKDKSEILHGTKRPDFSYDKVVYQISKTGIMEARDMQKQVTQIIHDTPAVTVNQPAREVTRDDVETVIHENPLVTLVKGLIGA